MHSAISTDHTPRTGSSAAPVSLSARLRRHGVALLVLWLAALALVSSAMVTARAVSPLDEAAHLDYVLRVPSSFPAAGEQMLPETLEVWSCRGTDLPGTVLPPCEAPVHPPDAYPGQGYGLAGAHPPVYYVVTSAVGGVVGALTPLDALDSYRSVGVLWLGAALSLTYALAIRVGASRIGAAGAALMVASVAESVTQAGVLGPDVAAWAAGGFVLLTALGHRGRARDTIWLLAACALAALVKQTTFLAVGAAMIALVLRRPLTGSPRGWDEGGREQGGWRGGWKNGWWQDWLLALAAALTFLGPSLGWSLYSAAQATVPPEEIPQNQWFVVEHLPFPIGAIANQVFAFLTPVSGGTTGAFLASQAEYRLAPMAEGLVLVGSLAAALSWRPRPRLAALGIGVLALAVLGGPLLATANYVLYGSFFDIHARYGFPLLAGMIAAASGALRERPWQRAVLVAGVVMFVLVLAQSDWLGVARG